MFRAFLTRFFLDQNSPLKNKLQFLLDSEICHRNFPWDFQRHSLNFYFCCQDDVLLKMSILTIKFWHLRNSTMIETFLIIQFYFNSKIVVILLFLFFHMWFKTHFTLLEIFFNLNICVRIPGWGPEPGLEAARQLWLGQKSVGQTRYWNLAGQEIPAFRE